MNKKYDIKFTELFYRDLNSITKYIKYELGNNIAANKLLDEVIQKTYKRADNPASYEKYPSIRKRNDTYYRIYVKNYTIFYVLKENTMEVRRMLYSRRNINI